jgi:hypothetical protein
MRFSLIYPFLKKGAGNASAARALGVPQAALADAVSYYMCLYRHTNTQLFFYKIF